MIMKNILTKIFLLMGVAALFAACTDDEEYKWADREKGLKLYFSESAPATYELEENQSSLSFWLYRNNTQGALTVDVEAACMTEGAQNLFTVPTQAVFADGEEKARLRVLFKFSQIETEKEYAFEAAVKAPENYSVYGASKLAFTTVFYPEWDDAGEGRLTIGAYSALFGLPDTATVPLQRKPGSNFYRIPRFAAYMMEENAEAVIADGYGGDEEAFNKDLEEAYKNSEHLVFQFNDENKNDGAADWNFYGMAAGAQEEGSFLYGGQVVDFLTGGTCVFATANFQPGYSGHCSFDSNSTVDHNYYMTTLFSFQGGLYGPFGMIFNWTKNAFVDDSEWVIATDYNADFSYEDISEATFTSKGFPAIAGADVKVQMSYDKEGLFYIPDAFGQAGYGLAFFVNDGKVTVPADQPTGILQQGMMVLAGPGSGTSKVENGVYDLSVEYYMLEVTQTPNTPTDNPDDDPGSGEEIDKSVPDPDDPAFVWPSGKVGEGERFEKVTTPAPEPAPEPEPGFTTSTRRISLGSFAEQVSATPTISIDDFCGEYAMEAVNFGYIMLGEDAAYYPGVKEQIGPQDVSIERGAAESEVVITGLFSGAANGDFFFDGASYKGKDKLTGIFNEVGGYVLIYPQTLAQKIVFPSTGAGKPDREFALSFATMDLDAGVPAENTPLKIIVTEAGLNLLPASDETPSVAGYAFYSSYDSSTPVNYDIPANISLTRK